MRITYQEKPFETAQDGVSGGAFDPVGYWHETVDIEPTEPLTDDLDCDVVIVGGGFTGLSTAYQLGRLAPELDVVLLERDVVGFGASGRNGGFAMPLLGRDLVHLVDEVGHDEARRACATMYDAVAHLRHLIDDSDLDCEKEETGYIILNTSDRREEHTRRDYELAQQMGYERQWLESDDLDEHIDSQAFQSGCYDPESFVVNPAKLARERKRLAEAVGVSVFEQSPAVELETERGVQVETPEGSVSADAAVLAVNGYAEALDFRTDRFVPVHTFITLTEPLSDERLADAGWNERRTSLETSRNLIHYFRLTEDNRILFGGEDIQLYYGGQFHDEDAGIAGDLRTRFREFFPSLDDVEFTHSWGGVLAVTLDMFPEFGVADDDGRVFYAGGYCGHGVALGNYSGKILAPKVAKSVGVGGEADGADPFFVDRTATWVPPEPLRYVSLQLYRRWLKLDDSWKGA